MELFSHLSDDQIALLGCAAALVTTSTIMSLSHFLGRSRNQTASMPAPVAMRVVAEASDLAEKRNAA
jgi:hypothetical protein